MKKKVDIFFTFFIMLIYVNVYSQYEILWSGKEIPNSIEMKNLQNINVEIIHSYSENKNYVWLKGVALEISDGVIFASFGHNTTFFENGPDERVNFRYKKLGDTKWSPLKALATVSDNYGMSHGIFLNHGGKLYAFHPTYFGSPKNGSEVFVKAYLLEYNNIDDSIYYNWQYQGVVARNNFWPMQEPVLMDNSKYITAGFSIMGGEKKNSIPAVAIFDSQDILKEWEIIKIPFSEDQIWGESSIIVNGSNILLISRSNEKILKALVSYSTDYGYTWSKLKISNLPMTDSKPYAGKLSNGMPYLINSISSDTYQRPFGRRFLSICLGDSGTFSFNRIYKLISNEYPISITKEFKIFAYPYAIERDGKLYVGFYSDAGNTIPYTDSGTAGLIQIPVQEILDDKISSVLENKDFIKSKTSLKNNFPNPFNNSTKLSFNLSETSNVEIKVFNLLGENLKTFSLAVLNAGTHYYDLNMSGYASGVYVVQLKASNEIKTQMILLAK